jgi:hypothetical protein
MLDRFPETQGDQADKEFATIKSSGVRLCWRIENAW